MALFALRRPPAPCCLATRASIQQSTPHRPTKILSVTEVHNGRKYVIKLHEKEQYATYTEAQEPYKIPSLDQAQFEPVKPVQFVQNFFLPRGWPQSVTKDYLDYQLWTVPAHVLGWMSHSLATSSMLKAVGIGFGAAGVVGTSAAIKWITKDGLGAVGRLFVGGKLSSVFDEDPKRWRMNAEFVTAVGLALEIATQLSPSNFVLLAGSGTLAKALGKGMGRPCFRVIQTYFSAQNNVGDVAAKEEVWEVTAQMLGLAFSVAVLQILESTNQPEALIIPIWVVVHATHTVFRYKALSALQFPYPNQRRAGMLVKSFLQTGVVPGVEEVNRGENLLLPPSACHPHAVFGCTIEDALQPGLPMGSPRQAEMMEIEGRILAGNADQGTPGMNGNISQRARELQQLVILYAGEQYMLTWHGNTAHVLLWEGATSKDYMRAMLQAACLEERGDGSVASVDQLLDSVQSMRDSWDAFAQQAVEQGWDLDQAVVPLGGTLLHSTL